MEGERYLEVPRTTAAALLPGSLVTTLANFRFKPNLTTVAVGYNCLARGYLLRNGELYFQDGEVKLPSVPRGHVLAIYDDI